MYLNKSYSSVFVVVKVPETKLPTSHFNCNVSLTEMHVKSMLVWILEHSVKALVTISYVCFASTHICLQLPPNCHPTLYSGDVVPPDATLVFDIHLLDLWNTADLVVTTTITTPKDCKRSVMRTDFVRYHFNGTLLDGTVFDSR